MVKRLDARERMPAPSSSPGSDRLRRNAKRLGGISTLFLTIQLLGACARLPIRPGSQGPTLEPVRGSISQLETGQAVPILILDKATGQEVWTYEQKTANGQIATVPLVPDPSNFGHYAKIIPIGANGQRLETNAQGDIMQDPNSPANYVPVAFVYESNMDTFLGFAIPGANSNVDGEKTPTFQLALTSDGIQAYEFASPTMTALDTSHLEYTLPFTENLSQQSLNNPGQFTLAWISDKSGKGNLIVSSTSPLSEFTVNNPVNSQDPLMDPQISIQKIDENGKPMVDAEGKPVFYAGGEQLGPNGGVLWLTTVFGEDRQATPKDLLGNTGDVTQPLIEIKEYVGPDLLNASPEQLQEYLMLTTPGVHEVAANINGKKTTVTVISRGGVSVDGTPNATIITPVEGYSFPVKNGVIEIQDSKGHVIGFYDPNVEFLTPVINQGNSGSQGSSGSQNPTESNRNLKSDFVESQGFCGGIVITDPSALAAFMNAAGYTYGVDPIPVLQFLPGQSPNAHIKLIGDWPNGPEAQNITDIIYPDGQIVPVGTEQPGSTGNSQWVFDSGQNAVISSGNDLYYFTVDGTSGTTTITNQKPSNDKWFFAGGSTASPIFLQQGFPAS